jgi:hypothetical protein
MIARPYVCGVHSGHVYPLGGGDEGERKG